MNLKRTKSSIVAPGPPLVLLGMGSPATNHLIPGTFFIIFNFLPLPLLLALISSQGARAEGAVAERRDKVAAGRVEVGCCASSDGEVEASLKQFTLRWNIFYIFSFGSQEYSVHSGVQS